MRIIRSFLIIGIGAFAAGIFYSKAGYDHGIQHWLFFGAAIVVAVAGLIDLAALALRSRRQPLCLK